MEQSKTTDASGGGELYEKLMALRLQAAEFADEAADNTSGPTSAFEAKERGRASAFAEAAELASEASLAASLADDSTVEQKITAAMYAVEEAGASRLLTLAVQMLEWAKSAVVLHQEQPLTDEENKLVEASWKKLADQFQVRAALATAPPAPTPDAGSDLETRMRAAFDAAHLMPAMALADDPIDAVMALAAAARQTPTDDMGNAFVLQHIVRVVNSFSAARPSPSPPPAENLVGQVAECRAMLLAGQGDDDGPQIAPDLDEGMSLVAMIASCLHLLEHRRDALVAWATSPSPPPAEDLAGQGEPVAIPDGWVLMPVKPTALMTYMGCEGIIASTKVVERLYEYMIAHRPDAPALYAAPAPSRPADREEIDLRAKAKALLDRLDTIHADPAYINVWAVSQLHAGPYRGPTYVAEADALQAALRDASRDGGDEPKKEDHR